MQALRAQLRVLRALNVALTGRLIISRCARGIDVKQRIRRRPDRQADSGDHLLRHRLKTNDRLLLVPRVRGAPERRTAEHRRRTGLRRGSTRQRLGVRARQPGTQVRSTALPGHTATALQVN